MARHDRDDHERHHRAGRQSQDKYSLHELKERARNEIDHSRRGRPEEHHRARHERDSRPRSRSRERPRNNFDRRSRSPMRDRHRSEHPNERRKDFAQSGDFERNRNNDRKPQPVPTGEPQSDSKPEEEIVPVKPNFELTGALSKDTNMFNGVLIKYNEPAEAKKPRKHWRFYPFKGDTPLDFIPLHRQSAYLFGRDRRVADVPVDHPSCSKQHAVVQFRSIEVDREDGTKARVTRPYIIDLESGNGTFVNNKQIEARRYVELLEKDVVKFGFSTREYVLLHEQSQGEEPESDTEV